MDKKNILSAIAIVVVVASISFTIVIYKDQILTYLSPLSSYVQPTITFIQQKITWIQTAWASIPEGLRGIILLGIPTAASLFFAWSKNRAMQKLQQTQQEAATMQQQAATTIGGLQSQLGDYEQLQSTANLAQTQISGFQTQIGTLQQQLQAKEAEVQRTIAERNSAQQIFAQFGVTCRFCGIQYLKYLPNCPQCHKPQVVA